MNRFRCITTVKNGRTGNKAGGAGGNQISSIVKIHTAIHTNGNVWVTVTQVADFFQNPVIKFLALKTHIVYPHELHKIYYRITILINQVKNLVSFLVWRPYVQSHAYFQAKSLILGRAVFAAKLLNRF